MVKSLEDWKYSNYLDWIGKRKGKLVNKDFILDRFGSVKNYNKFVEDKDEYKEPNNFDRVCLD